MNQNLARDEKMFIKTWLYRASTKRKMDRADQFISLWISFNAWLKSRYGHNLPDSTSIEKVGNNKELESIFDDIKKEKQYRKKLERIKLYNITDMRYPQNKNRNKRVESGEREFSSLMEAIYQIRCNLFHGRKNVSEKEGKDWELVYLAYDLLFPIFDSYLKRHII